MPGNAHGMLHRTKMPSPIEILNEQEVDGGWIFRIQVIDDDGTLHGRDLHLSWADYSMFSPDGATPPGRIAEAVMLVILEHPGSMPEVSTLDASFPRRYIKDADSFIRARI